MAIQSPAKDVSCQCQHNCCNSAHHTSHNGTYMVTPPYVATPLHCSTCMVQHAKSYRVTNNLVEAILNATPSSGSQSHSGNFQIKIIGMRMQHQNSIDWSEVYLCSLLVGQ
jgi:hypothetical protein